MLNFTTWADHVGAWLYAPSIIGIAFEVVSIYYSDYKYEPEILAYALFLMFWSVLLMRYWKRREHYMAMQWISQSERLVKPLPKIKVRFEYNGIEETSYITGKPERLESSFRLSPFLPLTVSFLLMVVVTALATVVALYVLHLQLALTGSLSYWEAQWIISAINAVLLVISNSLYYRLAVLLTNVENYYTDVDCERAIIGTCIIILLINISDL